MSARSRRRVNTQRLFYTYHLVIPAKAGTQRLFATKEARGPGFRRDDEVEAVAARACNTICDQGTQSNRQMPPAIDPHDLARHERCVTQ
jgi:hypothetical protein